MFKAFAGDPERARTSNLQLRRLSLYPIELRDHELIALYHGQGSGASDFGCCNAGLGIFGMLVGAILLLPLINDLARIDHIRFVRVGIQAQQLGRRAMEVFTQLA